MREKSNKYFILSGILTVLCMGLLTGCGGSASIALMDYVTVEFSGVDGRGTAVLNVDHVKMEQDMAGDDDGDISKEELEKIAQFTEFEFSINYELDKTEGLSNGDTVTVTVTYDKDLQKESGVKVKGDTSEKFKVEGLKEPVEVDAFDNSVWNTENGVKVSFDGVAPYGTLSIENNCDSSAPQSYVEYTADKTSELKNGDTIAVTAGLKPGAEDEGYVLKETEATITAEGLDSYVTDVSMLGAEDVGTLEDKLKEEIRAEYVDAFNFCTADGQSITILGDDAGTFGEPTFTGKGYAAVSDGSFVQTIFIFNMDVSDVTLYSWDGVYYDTPQTKTFSDMYGYCAVRDLKVSPDGKLITGEENYTEVSYELFETEDVMKNQLTSLYGELTEGTFAK